MPGLTSGKLCPICDSQIEAGAKKCSFCGTDLTMFEGEAKSAQRQEEKLVRETYPSPSSKPGTPTSELTSKTEPPKPGVSIGSEALFECPACGNKVKDSDKVCPHCGAVFEEETQFECPACGTLVNSAATKCPGCGATFIEDEAAGQEAPQTPVAPAVQPEKVEPAPSAPAVAREIKESEDEQMKNIISRIRETRESEKIPPQKKKPAKKGFGFFKTILPKGGDAHKKEESVKAEDGKDIATQKPAPPVEKKEAAAHATPAITAIPVPEPAPKRQWPSDPREQGKELARLVAEVRAQLNVAMDRSIFIDDTKILLDKAITAGRDRQFVLALDTIVEGQSKLNSQLREYVNANILSIYEEAAVAKRLGGNTSRADVFIRESTRAAEKFDYQASLVYIDKVRNELAPVTGQYNEIKESVRKFDRLVRDARVVGIDNEPLKKDYENAKNAFDALDFSKADGIIKKKTEEILSQIPARMGKEIDMAKQMLIEAKMKTDIGMAPQIAILKSAIRNMQEEKYLEALADLKHFKKELKKLLSPA